MNINLDHAPMIELEVSDLALNGRGVARQDKKVYFIKDAFPGDRVLCEIQNADRKFEDATISAYQKTSSERKASPCPLNRQCGGCAWLELNDEAQVQWKKKLLINTLQRALKENITFDDLNFHPSPQTLNYRSRCVLHCKADQSGIARLGYFRQGTKDLITIPHCPILHPEINQFLTWFNQQRLKLNADYSCHFECQLLPNAVDKETASLVVVMYGDHSLPDLEHLFNVSALSYPLAFIGRAGTKEERPLLFYEYDTDINYFHSPGHFQQANVLANHRLRELIKQLVLKIKPQTVLDLFCGNGNLSLGLAGIVGQIIGVEASRSAIFSARKALEVNAIKNAQYFATNCEQFLWSNFRRGSAFDCIILDPPREGLQKAVKPLCLLRAPNLVYVSCDPLSLSHDLAKLCSSGYSIRQIEAIDLFPQTPHLETIVTLGLT